MAQRLETLNSIEQPTFPPEADGSFEVVPTQEISEWREKLNARFDLGKSRLKVISEPEAQD